MPFAILRPNDVVSNSGVYRVRHQDHRADHVVTAIKGERLPPCRTCGSNVSFELIKAAEYIVEESDFSQSLAG